MNTFETLESCAGNWQGTNRLHDPGTGKPEDSLSALTIARNATEIGLRYTWSYQNETQQGNLVLHKDTAGHITADWTDSWHTSGEPMIFTQEEGITGISLIGSYSAPPGPDWGWRIVLEPGEALQVRMYNIPPGEQAQIAVECTYYRTGS